MLDSERLEIHVVEAARIHRDHGLSGFHRVSAAKGGDAAARAEKVVDVLLVEEVIGEIPFALEQLEFVGADEREEGSFATAHRAVAGHDFFVEIDRGLVANLAAVTAA